MRNLVFGLKLLLPAFFFMLTLTACDIFVEDNPETVVVRDQQPDVVVIEDNTPDNPPVEVDITID
jgi:hypothetical protein